MSNPYTARSRFRPAEKVVTAIASGACSRGANRFFREVQPAQLKGAVGCQPVLLSEFERTLVAFLDGGPHAFHGPGAGELDRSLEELLADTPAAGLGQDPYVDPRHPGFRGRCASSPTEPAPNSRRQDSPAGEAFHGVLLG